MLFTGSVDVVVYSHRTNRLKIMSLIDTEEVIDQVRNKLKKGRFVALESTFYGTPIAFEEMVIVGFL